MAADKSKSRRLVFSFILLAAIRAQTPDHYAALGIKRTATLAEVKKAYRAKALTSHPDKAKAGEEEAATEAFHKIAAAYETLSDPQARRQYDAGGNPFGTGGRGGGNPFDPFGFGGFGGFGFGRHQQRGGWNGDRYHEHFLRPEVRRAQERPIKLSSLDHLRATGLGEDGRTERALLLALVDGTESCAKTLKYDTQFPSPFAGWSDAAIGAFVAALLAKKV